jgi:uncharacterized membrane protein YedE/YeeE
MVENSATNYIFIFVLFVAIICLVSMLVVGVWVSIVKRPKKDDDETLTKDQKDI